MPQITLDQWQQILALLTPFLISFFVQSHWSSQVKRAVAVVAAVAISTVPELIQGKVNGPHLVGEALVVVAASQGVYHLFSSKFGNMTAATDTTQPALPSAPSVPTRPPGA
jgi:L-lactate permease